MKVLYIATVTEHITGFHLPYLERLKEQGCEVHVAARGDTPPCGENIPHCDKKYNISIRRSPFKLNNIKAYFELKNIIRKEKYDIIHGHTPMGGILARLCGKKQRKAGMKIFYTAHGFHFYKGAPLINWLLYYPIEKWLSKYTDVLININIEDYELSKRKMKSKNIYYIPGIGIDTDKFSKPDTDRETKRRELKIPPEATVVISVGELSKRKNHRAAIKAVSKIKTGKLYYIICGSGKLKDYLIKLCKKLKIEDRVLFLGHRSDTADLLHMSDIFLFPSIQEGLPVALMEAMAAGLPCIASKIRGNTDLLDGCKGNYLCSINNIGGYANAVEKLMRDKNLCGGIGDYNKTAVKKFDIAAVMDRMNKIYGGI